ncbi:MAG: helix-turn-helix domain-containing protein [Microgenomates group bacterium]
MKTIGEILRSARVSKKISFGQLENKTKIKTEFMKSIEEEDWKSLPPFPTTLGFVKSLASALGLNEKTIVAVLKRDYPPQKDVVEPKPDVINKFSWSPRLTFILSIAVVLISVLGYLVVQYAKFVAPPSLKVEAPREDELVEGKYVVVSGTTDTDAKVIVNSQPVLVDDNGKFLIGLEIIPGTKEVVIKASGRSGKETTIKRQINVKSN